MKFDSLLETVGSEPVFESSLLLAGEHDPGDVRRQLSRWVDAGRIHRLRRGLYSLAEPFRRTVPHPFLIANRLRPGSYVSCQSALAWYGRIPEYVPMVTSVHHGRPARWTTTLGRFQVRHLKPDLMTGFEYLDLGQDQWGYVATPEKALLDLIHLTPGGDQRPYLEELRLQHLEEWDWDRLDRLVADADSPKLQRAASVLHELSASDEYLFEDL